MYTFKVNRNSWHYFLATVLSSFDFLPKEKQTFCSYLTHFLRGLVAAVSFVIGALFVVGFIVHGFYEIVMAVMYGETLAKGVGSGALVAILLAVAMVTIALKLAWEALIITAEEVMDVIIHTKSAWQRRTDNKETQSLTDSDEVKSGFIRTVYNKIKDKTCVKIEVV